MSSPIEPTTTPDAPAKVAWNRVALYYGIAFGFACLLGLALWLAGANLISGAAKPVFTLTLAFLYMPLPIVAALIVEKRAGPRLPARRGEAHHPAQHRPGGADLVHGRASASTSRTWA